ncbi:MAG TPA: pilus assembly protein PilM [Candidatus Omnitrophota bacterium]|nr:pilus assembly protein PilM [Candidatus Omnitrophota bacterium]HPT06532.1 pilus assembly protein PilM [Candidatus Omnitrophota bacterium]
MSSLGIFFGPHIISLVETKARKIINTVQINRSSLVASGSEEKIPEELKLVAVFKDELRRNKIEPTEATLALSGSDLVIRTFEMPLLPSEELRSAVNFEVKKYIPFKIEDLVADYQVEYDKVGRRNIVLFAGIKKETLNKYLSILNQINVKVNAIEYAAFSALRFVKLSGLGQRGVVAVLNVDIQEDDEVNFIVLANGFPLFSRDITLSVASDESLQTAALTPQQLLEKLKTELRVSVDFYNRKYPGRKLEKIIFLVNDDLRVDLESFSKELGLPGVFINSSKVLGRVGTYSLSIIKGFSASFSKITKTNVKLNLISGRASAPGKSGAFGLEIASLVNGVQLDFRLVLVALLMCGGVYGYGQYLSYPVKQDVEKIKSERPTVQTASAASSYDELVGINTQYTEKIKALDDILYKQLYVTTPMNSIAKLIPEGVWLTTFSYSQQSGKAELTLNGSAALGSSTKEFEAVNKFIISLKSDPQFQKIFDQINLISVQQSSDASSRRSDFSVSCKQGK